MALSPARIAEIAPFVVGVTIGEVAAYRASVPSDLMIVSQARVPLRPDVPSRFVVFRGGGSLHDQVAIVVGTPPVDAPVPVRLHSACLTGDLFGSLKCDCGDQLRNTVARFHESAAAWLSRPGRPRHRHRQQDAGLSAAKPASTIDAVRSSASATTNATIRKRRGCYNCSAFRWRCTPTTRASSRRSGAPG
jgi:hypothetical protein